jgi:hypothetical protein
MTAQTDPYVRVYYRIIDDPKFANVFDDKGTLGWWVTLLLAADATYPAPAHLPRKIKDATLAKLTEAGLVDLLDGERYRIRGLASERDTRAEAARFAADAKHHGHPEAVRRQSERNADALRTASRPDAETLPLRSSPLRSAPIQSAPLRTAPTPAGAEKHGSKNLETDEERMARYLALRDDPSKSADIRYAAENEVKRLEALRLN